MQILKLIYVGVVLPYLIGQAWLRILSTARKDNGILIAYAHGMVGLGGIFFATSLLPLQQGWSLGRLSALCWYASLLVGLVCIAIANRHLIDGIYTTTKRAREADATRWIILVMAVLGVVYGIFGTLPSSEDTTTELVGMMVDTDVLYGADPLTGIAYDDGRVNHTPIEAAYAVLSRMSGLESTQMIHHLLPLLLIPAYYGAFLVLLHTFIKEKKYRNLAFGVILLLLVVETLRAGTLNFGVFTNPWAGVTLVTLLVFPMQFAIICRLAQQERIPWLGLILSAGACILAAQLGSTKGGAYSAVGFALGVFLLLWYRQYNGRRNVA